MTRHRLLALLAALAPAFIGLLVGASVAAQDATPTSGPVALGGAITNVRYFVPFTPDGLNSHLHATSTEDGTCDAPAAAALNRSDAWSCASASNQVYDPCFENPFILPDQPGQVACVDSPFTTDVVVLDLQSPLPRHKEVQSPAATGPQPGASAGMVAAPAAPNLDDPYSIAPWDLPWALELANGDRCSLLRGTLSVMAGQTVYYGCEKDGAIIGEVHHGGDLWMVNYLASGDVASTLVPVATAWS